MIPVNDLNDLNDGQRICAAQVEKLGFSLGHDWRTAWSPVLSDQKGSPMLVCNRCGENGWTLS